MVPSSPPALTLSICRILGPHALPNGERGHCSTHRDSPSSQPAQPTVLPSFPSSSSYPAAAAAAAAATAAAQVHRARLCIDRSVFSQAKPACGVCPSVLFTFSGTKYFLVLEDMLEFDLRWPLEKYFGEHHRGVTRARSTDGAVAIGNDAAVQR